MNRLALFVLLLLFWIALTWPATSPRPTYWQDVGAGAAAALLVTWIAGKRSSAGAESEEAATEGVGRWLDPRRYAWAFIYALVLAAYVVKANVEVAYRVLHPAMPIRPGIVRVETRLRRPTARALLGNSITLCPGTLTVDLRDDGVMMVHWIYVRTLDEEQAARQIIGRFEWFIKKILD